ncbi:GDP dissociation inhibitor-domain-containing protein [Scleroderma yunnanense]
MENEFDVIILGTGLTESITAAALAKAGLKVAHVDPNAYYGADEATLTLDELVAWAERHSSQENTDQEGCIKYDVAFQSAVEVSHPKQYTLSLSPSVIPAVGPFITSIIASGVARYSSFKLLGSVLIYNNDHFKAVPRGKEDVFRDQQIPLLEKRRLMRFLMFAAEQYESSPEFQDKGRGLFLDFLRQAFSLSENLVETVAFALAYCTSSDEPTSSALTRVQSCLRSTGRYGPSPFLVSYYGGSGELAQGFCRAAAVNGGVYILGRRITNITFNDPSLSRDTNGGHRYTLELDGFPEPLHASCLLSSLPHIPDRLRWRIVPDLPEPSYGQPFPCRVARGIVILDGVISPPCSADEESQTEQGSDSLIMVFPPASIKGGSDVSSVQVLTVASGTMCAPPGKSIIYLSMSLDDQEGNPKDLLEPYLNAILSTNVPPYHCLFQIFYTQHIPDHPQQSVPAPSSDENLWVVPVLPPDISHGIDFAAQVAEKAFWKIITSIRGPNISLDVSNGFWVDSMQGGVEEDSD